MLTGDVLKLANSAYYRSPGEPVSTLDRAVSRLGIDGLRTIASASVLQPIFRIPKGSFEQFPTIIWDQAMKSALAAQAFARRSRNCDAFSAHLLGLLTAIGRIVMFRLTLDRYAGKPGLQPEPQVLITLLDEHADRISLAIAKDWEFEPTMHQAIEAHVARASVDTMSPLARALYYGRLCGTGAVLFEHGKLSEPKGIALRKGLDEKEFEFMWQTVLPASAD
jgi:HD-like signal output (HDOD) protein